LDATYTSGTNIDLSGIGTIPTINSTRVNGTYISGTDLNYSGIGTISTLNSSVGNVTYVNGTNANFTGIATFATLNTTAFGSQYLSAVNFTSSGIATVPNLYVATTQVLDSSRNLRNIASANVSGILTAQSLKASDDLYVGSQRLFENITNLFVRSPGNIFLQNTDGSNYAGFISGAETRLYHANSKQFETTGVGATVFGQLDTQSLRVSGVTTSTGGFVGNLTGNATSANYATTAGVSTYATTAGIATNATNATNATYATTAGIATNATNVSITNSASLASVCNVTFVNATSGNSNLLIDQAALNFVPSTNTFFTPNISATGQINCNSLLIDNSPTAYTLTAQSNGQIGIGLTPAFGAKLEVGGDTLFYNRVAVGTTIFGGAGNFRGGAADVGGEYNLIVQSSDMTTKPAVISGNSSVGSIQIFSGGVASSSARGGQIDFVGGNASTYPGQLLFRTGTVTGGTSQNITARLDTFGNLFATQFTSTSDENKKTNIRPI